MEPVRAQVVRVAHRACTGEEAEADGVGAAAGADEGEKAMTWRNI